MRKVFSFVKGKREDRRDNKINPTISVEITNPSGQKITSDDEHIVGLQQGYGYNIDLNGKDKTMPKLHKAVWVGNIEKVKIHSKKIDVNSVDTLNRTPLHLAVAQGHTEVAWYLLNNNASMDVCDGEGLTPFLKAIECGNKDCVNLLIECGVNVNCTDRNGNNGLHLASRHGFYNIASLLLKEGVSHDVSNNVGEFPLHIATGCEHRELVELLLRSGANVEALDRERRCPLMLAARSGLHSIIKVLLDNGASLEAADSNGWTAEDYAQFGGHQDLVEILKTGQKEEAVEQPDRLSVHSSDTSENVPPSQQSHQEAGNEEQQDSPRSCVTPPALEPPRSWDLIQSGAIDQGDNRRRSLMTLGTLKSHQDNFGDGASDHGSRTPELSPLMLPSPTGDSIPLENRLSPVPLSDLVPTPERRTRSPLERANSLDLPSDQDSPIQMGPDGRTFSPVFNDMWETKTKYSPNINERSQESVETNVLNLLEKNNNIAEKLDNDTENITLNNNDTLKEIVNVSTVSNNETNLIITNENFNSSFKDEANNDSKANDLTGTDRLSSMDCSDSFDNLDEKSSYTDHFYAGASCSLDNLDDMVEKKMSIEIIQSTGKLDDTLAICTIPLKGKFRESHSLDIIETTGNEEALKHSKGKKHARNKSITLSGQPQLWKSVDALSKPTSMDRGTDIDAQLLCYDEALRQLANIPKQNHETTADNSVGNFPENISSDEVASNASPDKNIVESEIFQPPENAAKVVFETGADDELNTPSPMRSDGETFEVNQDVNSLEHELPSLETEKDEGFPPPPKCFMENEDDITLINTIEILNNTTMPLSKLTPIKENYLELDSLTSNIDAPDSDNTENSIERSDSESECLSRPLRRKRKILVAMRGPGVDSKEKMDNAVDEHDDDNDSTEDDPPFWQSTDKGGTFTRQETVVSAPSMTPRNTPCRDDEVNVPGTSSVKLECEKESTSPSSDAETASAADTPKHIFAPKGHQNILQAHLREATIEKGRLEETAASLREKAERLKYELADARQAEVARDDTIAILQAQLKRLEDRYTKGQEDLCTLRQKATNAEHELQHLRQLCKSLKEEKEKLCRELAMHVNCPGSRVPINLDQEDHLQNSCNEDLINKIVILENEKSNEEEKNRQLVQRLEELLLTNQAMVAEKEALIAQNIADVRKLQEDTLCWKERYEECAAKLELMDKSLDPRLIEAQDTIATLKRTISILQQEKASHAKLSDASTSTYSPRRREYLIVQGSGDASESETNPKENAIKMIQQELNAIRQQLELAVIPDPVNSDDIEPTQKTVIELQQKLETEASKRFSLDLQVKRLLTELQEKLELEAEINRMNKRLDEDFVSKQELELLTNKQNEAIGQIKQQTIMESENKLGEKLVEINKMIQQQIKEQARIDKERITTEISIKQEFEQTRQKLHVELSKVHAALKAKETEEKLLREKCEHLAREVERMQDLRRKSLLDKSYSVNLSDLSPSRTGSNSQLLHSSLSSSQNHRPSPGNSLKSQLGNSIEKHTNTGSADSKVSSLSVEEKLTEDLKKKYLKH